MRLYKYKVMLFDSIEDYIQFDSTDVSREVPAFKNLGLNTQVSWIFSPRIQTASIWTLLSLFLLFFCSSFVHASSAMLPLLLAQPLPLELLAKGMSSGWHRAKWFQDRSQIRKQWELHVRPAPQLTSCLTWGIASCLKSVSSVERR